MTLTFDWICVPYLWAFQLYQALPQVFLEPILLLTQLIPEGVQKAIFSNLLSLTMSFFSTIGQRDNCHLIPQIVSPWRCKYVWV